MTKLLKYEFMRRKHMLIGAAITMLFVEGAALLGIYNGGGWRILGENGWNGWNILAVAMTALLIIGPCVLVFLDAVTRLYSDYKQKHGYMILMTPQSGYRIIWAKTVFSLIEMLAAGLAIAGCLALSCMAIEHVYGGVSKFFAEPPVDLGVLTGVGLSCIMLGLLQFMAQLSIAILAVTVTRVMTQGSSYNWLIALLMYFALAVIVNMVNGALLLAFGVAGDIMNWDDIIKSGFIAKYLIIGAVTYSAWFAGCTLLSGRLINRGIDL